MSGSVLPSTNLEEDLIAWHVAAWNGPAKQDEQIMAQLIDGSVDHGFGHVKRFLLSISTPQSLAPRVVALWREEFSTGRLEASLIERRSIRLTLHDHPYVDIPLMRLVIAEVFRYIVSLTKAKRVSAAHTVRGSALVVDLHWA
jgi:hypothetical protein